MASRFEPPLTMANTRDRYEVLPESPPFRETYNPVATLVDYVPLCYNWGVSATASIARMAVLLGRRHGETVAATDRTCDSGIRRGVERVTGSIQLVRTYSKGVFICASGFRLD